MTKKPKGPTKGQVKSAADRAEARSAKPKAKDAAKAEPKAAPAPSAVRMILKGHLTTLMTQVLNFQNKVSTAAGDMGDLIRDYADKKNLHRGAFSDIKKLYRMGKKDPGKLWLHLAHFDDMRQKLELDALAGEQGQLVESGTDDGAENQDDQPKAPGATVSRPKFGAGHPNFGDGNEQVIADAVAGSASDKVNDIAKAAGAKTAS